RNGVSDTDLARRESRNSKTLRNPLQARIDNQRTRIGVAGRRKDEENFHDDALKCGTLVSLQLMGRRSQTIVNDARRRRRSGRDLHGLETIDVGGCDLEVTLGENVLRRKQRPQFVDVRVSMIGEITHKCCAYIEAQGGVALGIVLDDSAQVGGETSEAGGRGFSLDGEGFLVIDEAWPYLGENPEVFKARS